MTKEEYKAPKHCKKFMELKTEKLYPRGITELTFQCNSCGNIIVLDYYELDEVSLKSQTKENKK